jgi:hypothetical protein
MFQAIKNLWSPTVESMRAQRLNEAKADLLLAELNLEEFTARVPMLRSRVHRLQRETVTPIEEKV